MGSKPSLYPLSIFPWLTSLFTSIFSSSGTRIKQHSEGMETQGVNACGKIGVYKRHACTGAASACNITNTNPPQGRGESPNLPSSYPDIATSSHQQSQAARIMNPGGSEIPPTRPQIDPDTTQFSYNNSGRQYIRAATNQIGYVKGNDNGNINLDNSGTSSFTQSQSVADNIAPRSDETRLLSYQNSGYQCIHGVTNQTGFVKGNGNGIINVGSSNNQSHSEVDVTAKLDALLKLIPGESHMGDGTRTQPNSSSTTLRGENHQPHNFSNTGNQTFEGLANQIGIIDGDNNGVVCADI